MIKSVAMDLEASVNRCLLKHSQSLREVSLELWQHPELAFKEHRAHDLLCNFLEEQGFNVERHYLLPTAFRACFSTNNGSEGPTLCVICEYDALPDIGHACGHNLIAIAGLATALAVKETLQDIQIYNNLVGSLVVLGTPGEEGGGGKILLQEQGAFKGIQAAAMLHPVPHGILLSTTMCSARIIATIRGKMMHHSAVTYDLNANAMDTAVAAYTSLSLLRAHMKPTWRLCVIISKGGQPGYVPEEVQLELSYRTDHGEEMKHFGQRVIKCLEATAQSMGCNVTTTSTSPYLDMWNNSTFASIFYGHLKDPGKYFQMMESEIRGSTDMGNISHALPSIHPFYALDTMAPNHTAAFTEAAATRDAHERTLANASALAIAFLDIFQDPKLLQNIQKGFEEQRTARPP